jgi:hypothetical protein
MDLRIPLDLTADPAKNTEDLEQAHLALLDKAVGIEDTRRRVNSTFREYNTTDLRQRRRDLGTQLNYVAPSARSPPIIAKPTYNTPTKNLHATRYITSELASLQGEELREKQTRVRAPELHRSTTAGDGAGRGGQRHVARQLPHHSRPEQASGAASFIAQPRPGGAQPEQPSLWQERWKSPHPALRLP